MKNNLRILDIKVVSSTLIKTRFNYDLTPFLTKENVYISSTLKEISDSEILNVYVEQLRPKILVIECKPLIPQAPYFIEFKSTINFKFKSLNGEAVLLEDGNTNKPLIFGISETDNPILQQLTNTLIDLNHNLDEGATQSLVDLQSKLLSRALYDIKQLKSDNYLSITVIDEEKIRGAGPFDRLNQEGAFQLLRVSKFPSQSFLNHKTFIESFPFYTVSLLTTPVVDEKLLIGNTNLPGFYNNLILNLEKKNIIKINKITFNYTSNNNIYEYPLSSFGYKILDSKFDPEVASSYLGLNSNQVLLNESVLSDEGFSVPNGSDFVSIDYQYKSLNKKINFDTLKIYELVNVVREPAPPLINFFSTKNFPIINENNTPGIEFLNPQALVPFSTKHPAFNKEIIFQSSDMPSNPGEYSIDYLAGKIFVYGSSLNDGTGEYPPGMSYKFKKEYVPNLDFFIFEDNSEIVANLDRELVQKSVYIEFSYEEVLNPDEDYTARLHQEEINERIENRLIKLNILKTKYNQITNVFKIFNETSGEIYKINYWLDNQIHFIYSFPPRILGITAERAKFKRIFNEQLLVFSEKYNDNNIRIFQINLNYTNLIAATEDCIGSSINNNIEFSENEIFKNELYFDNQILSLNDNLNRLDVNKFQIDFINGIIYLGVSENKDYNLGTITYISPIIESTNKHLITVDEIYYSLNLVNGITERFDYLSFDDQNILPKQFDRSDERFTESNSSLPYIVDNNTITVTKNIKIVRGIFDNFDLNNNDNPFNFVEGCEFINNIITLNPSGVQNQELSLVLSGNLINLSFSSPGIEIIAVMSVIRQTDKVDLWDSFGSFFNNQIQLSGINSPTPDDTVLVIFKIKLNSNATPIVDYDKGELFIDYTYLADEIIVSYEHGDNHLDFSQASTKLITGNTYYVSYKYGALRDSLLKNFGSIINIPIYKNFDLDLEREDYRTALMAFYFNFLKGSTKSSLEAIGEIFTKITPEIIEDIYESWSLGTSFLYPSKIKFSKNLQLMPGKFDNGILINQDQQFIKFSACSNIRLESGTIEFWTIPQWNGLDNDANLTFSLFKDDQNIDKNKIFIGASGFNPEINAKNEFIIYKNSEPSAIGLPYKIYTEESGIFIFYDDVNKLWKVYAKDKVYDSNYSINYSGTIISSGEVYHVQFLPGLGEVSDSLTSDINTINFSFNIDYQDFLFPDGYTDGYSQTDGYFPLDGYSAGFSFDGISFMADNFHYFFDMGNKNDNRISLFKDGSGYLNFKIIDKESNIANLSSDISNWKIGENHHIAVSWKLNSVEFQDEMHLFIDGKEVFNILKYGGRPIASSEDRFRTVKPEIPIINITKKSIKTQINTTLNSNIIIGSVNFESEGIIPGDQIEIDEIGFSTYTIVNVNGNILSLLDNMPASLPDALCYINPLLISDISISLTNYSNIVVKVEDRELAGPRADEPQYKIINKNTLKILDNVNPNENIYIYTLGLNHRRIRQSVYLWNQTNIFKTQLPSPLDFSQIKIYSNILPLTSIGPHNSTESAGIFTSNNILLNQPSNSMEGRRLSVRITSDNVDFSIPAEVTIYGLASDSSFQETLLFNSALKKITLKKFLSLSHIVVNVKPYLTDVESIAVEIFEAFSITEADGNSTVPIIKYSFKTFNGNALKKIDTNLLQDLTANFLPSMQGQSLVILNPGTVAGTYIISEVIDANTLKMENSFVDFDNGIYEIYQVGFNQYAYQNGFFYLETGNMINQPYLVPAGYYLFDYPSFLSLKFDSFVDQNCFLGSDINQHNQANAIIDEFVSYNTILTDIRTGEFPILNEPYITTDFLKKKEIKYVNSDILMLLHLNSLPLINSAKFYKISENDYQSTDISVNSHFEKSIILNSRPYILENLGYISSSSEGSIEFWISPIYDTINDPLVRYYLDSTSSITEDTISITVGTVKVSQRVSEILSVKLQTDTQDTTFGTDYFANGKIESDFQTLTLNKKLPFQKTPVEITYLPSGIFGNRISIYKNNFSELVFEIKSDTNIISIKRKINWTKNSWHRILAIFKFNSLNNQDYIQLFIDGELVKSVFLFIKELKFNNNVVYKSVIVGIAASVFEE